MDSVLGLFHSISSLGACQLGAFGNVGDILLLLPFASVLTSIHEEVRESLVVTVLLGASLGLLCRGMARDPTDLPPCSLSYRHLLSTCCVHGNREQEQPMPPSRA